MRIFRLLALGCCLAALAPGDAELIAQDSSPAGEYGALSGAEAVTAADIIAQAMETSPDVVSAKNSLAQARLAYQQTLPLKGTSFSAGVNDQYRAGEIEGGSDARNSIGGSLSVRAPILPNLSASASLTLSSDIADGAGITGSGGVDWFPLASNQSSKNAKVAYDLALASYAQALRDARQSVSAYIMGFMDAMNALDSAKEGRALADISLKGVMSEEAMGQASASDLLKAQKDMATAEGALSKAERAVEKARAALAFAVGGELGDRIAAGAAVDAEGLDSSGEWTAPAFSELPKKRAVLKAEADLETAKNSVNSWSDATSSKVSNGPLSLTVGVDTDMKISLSGKISLDLAQVDGSDAKSKKLAIEAARLALDKAVFDAKAEYQDAVDAAHAALLALKDAEYQHELDARAAEAAKIKWAVASISETEYRSAVSAEKNSAAKETAARLALAKARAWFTAN